MLYNIHLYTLNDKNSKFENEKANNKASNNLFKLRGCIFSVNETQGELSVQFSFSFTRNDWVDITVLLCVLFASYNFKHASAQKYIE